MANEIYVAMISGGPLKEPKFEKVEITEEEIIELQEEEDYETREDAIDFIKEDYISSYEQRGCKCVLLSEEQFNGIFNFVGEFLKKD